MALVFYGIKWKVDPPTPYIWYGNPEKIEITKRKLKKGEEFNIKILNHQFCIGSETGRGKWITCKERRIRDGEENVGSSYLMKLARLTTEEDRSNPDVMVLADGKIYRQCYRCSTTEYFTCRMTCVGDTCIPTSDRAKSLCDPPNTSIYLTYVGGQFKVGVSLGIPRRWIEQGSDLATVIATAPGLEARRLEQYLARELDLKLQVRSKTKIQNLSKINLKSAKQKLSEIIKQSKPMIDKILGDVKGITIRKPEIRDLSPIYGDFRISTPIQEIDIKPGAEFGGEIVSIKGAILIVKQGDYHYAINLKALQSKEFTFLENRPQIETQSFLDQWF